MTADRGALARTVAAAAHAVPGVSQLTGGKGAVTAATHYPGGTVRGVQLAPDKVSVHIVAARLPLAPVADEVLRAARSALDVMGDPRAVEVVVEDIDDAALGVLGTATGGPS